MSIYLKVSKIDTSRIEGVFDIIKNIEGGNDILYVVG